MITREEVKKLAILARMEIGDDEIDKLTLEVDSILGYVGQIQNTTGDFKTELPKLRNVLREDVVTNKPGEYTEALLQNAPARDGNYLKVKKILG